MSRTLQINYPLTLTNESDDRLKRYILCLQMVQLIVDRELNEESDETLYTELGTVASFIDLQLDGLSVLECEQLLKEFETLYEHLAQTNDYAKFEFVINQYAKSHGLKFECTDRNISQLFQLMERCKDQGLTSVLGEFGKNIIVCAIQKRQAKSSIRIRLILKQEGALVCELLKNLLKKNHSCNLNFSRTIKFLIECEQILNLADDCLDTFDDKRNNVIQVKNQYLHGLIMAAYLIKQIAKTFLLFPKQFLYYTPTLIGFYLRNK